MSMSRATHGLRESFRSASRAHRTAAVGRCSRTSRTASCHPQTPAGGGAGAWVQQPYGQSAAEVSGRFNGGAALLLVRPQVRIAQARVAAAAHNLAGFHFGFGADHQTRWLDMLRFHGRTVRTRAALRRRAHPSAAKVALVGVFVFRCFSIRFSILVPGFRFGN